MSLLFPLVFWDSTKPEHPITCVMAGENYIVTGAATGELCYWRVTEDDYHRTGVRTSAGALKRYIPRALLMREDFSGVTAVTRCQIGGQDNIFSSNAEGFLTRWLPSGGNCFTSLSIFPFAPAKLLVPPLPPPSMLDERESPTPYLVVQGDSTDVQVVNLLNMQLAKVLKHRSKVVGICLTPPSHVRMAYVMTLTELGGLYLWDLERPEAPAYAVRLTKLLGLMPPAPPPAPSGPVTAGTPAAAAALAAMAAANIAPPSAPACVSVSNDGLRFLIVMKYHWVVASLKDFKMESPLMTSAQSYPSDVYWIGGSFLLDSDRVVLWTSTGYIDAYVLTPTAVPVVAGAAAGAAGAKTAVVAPAMPNLDLSAPAPTPTTAAAAATPNTQAATAMLHSQPAGFFASFMAGHGPSAFNFAAANAPSGNPPLSASSSLTGDSVPHSGPQAIPSARNANGSGTSSSMHADAEPMSHSVNSHDEKSFTQIHNPKLVTAASVTTPANGTHPTNGSSDSNGRHPRTESHDEGAIPPTPTARPMNAPTTATAVVYSVTPHLLAKLEKGDEKDQFQWMYGAPEGDEKVVVVEVDGDDIWQGDSQGSLYHWRVPRAAKTKKPVTLYANKQAVPSTAAATTTAAAVAAATKPSTTAADTKKESEDPFPAIFGKDKKLLPVQVLSIGDGFMDPPKSAFSLDDTPAYRPKQLVQPTATQPLPRRNSLTKSTSEQNLSRPPQSTTGAPVASTPGVTAAAATATQSSPAKPIATAGTAPATPTIQAPTAVRPTPGVAQPQTIKVTAPVQAGAIAASPQPAVRPTTSGTAPVTPTPAPTATGAAFKPTVSPNPAPVASGTTAGVSPAKPAPIIVPVTGRPSLTTPATPATPSTPGVISAGTSSGSGSRLQVSLHPSNLQVRTDVKSLTPSPQSNFGRAPSSAVPLPKQQRTIHVYEDEQNPCTASVMYKSHDLDTTVLLFRGYKRGEIRAYKLLSQDYKEEMKLLGHHDEVTCMIAITRDESVIRRPLLLSASKDRTLRLWDLSVSTTADGTVGAGKLYGKFKCTSPVLSLHWFAPYPLTERQLERQALARAARAKFRRAQQLQQEKLKPQPQVRAAPAMDETHMKLSDFHASASINTTTATSTPVHSTTAGSGGPHHLTLNLGASGGSSSSAADDDNMPDESAYEGQPGDLVFAVCQDRSVYVFSILTMQPLQILRGHDSMVHYVYRDRWCIAADYVITHSKRGTVYVWVLSTGHLERCFAANTKECNVFLKSRGLLGQRSQVFVSPSTYAADHGVGHASQPSTPRTPVSGGFDRKSPSIRSVGAKELAVAKSPESELIHVVPFPGPAQHLHVSVYVLNLGRLLDALRNKYSLLRNLSPEEFARELSKRGGDFLAFNCMLSALFDWNVDHELDRMTKEHLEYFEPYPPRSFGTITDKGRAMTVLFPYQSAGLGRWRFDSFFSAYQSISLSTVCMALLTAVGHPSQQVYFSRIVAHYSVIIPDSMRGYVEPDVEVLAEYSLNESEEVYTVARLLLQGVLERSKPSRRVDMVKKWSSFYTTRDQSEVRFVSAATPSGGAAGLYKNPYESAPPALTPRARIAGITGTASSTPTNASGVGMVTATGAVAYDAPVSDRELMTALVLCLIGVFDSGRKDRDEKKRQKLEEQRAAAAAAAAAANATQSAEKDGEGEEVVDFVDGDKAVKQQQAASGPSPAGGAAPSPDKKTAAAGTGKDAKSGEGEQEREGLDERQEFEQEKVRIRKEFEKLKKDSEYGSSLEAIELVSGYITNTLLRVLNVIKGTGNESQRDVVRCALATELLGKGFPLWHQHVNDLVDLIRRLHHLSLVKQTSLAAAAHRALLQAGKAAPKHFVSCMGREALNPKNSGRGRAGALLAIVALVRKYPVSLARVLPSTVQIILRCLDPSDPELRRNLLHSSTAALHVLVQKYPMTSFHQKSQRFAVGTGVAQQSVIIIYDLRTAIKWRILEGHRGNVSAISFNAQGNVLVSYSADENPPAFCVWNTASAGLLSGLWRIQGRCIRVYKLHPIKSTRKFSLSEHLENIKITWISLKRVRLRREDGSICNFNT